MIKADEVKLSDLYQEVILDHNRHPRNFGKLGDANRHAHGINPLCGDDYHLYLNVDARGGIQKIGFDGHGCAISKSCASLMTTVLESKDVARASELKDWFIELLTRETLSPDKKAALGKMKIFEGVRQFPVRVKCATLIWRTLEAALCAGGAQMEISTEK